MFREIFSEYGEGFKRAYSHYDNQYYDDLKRCCMEEYLYTYADDVADFDVDFMERFDIIPYWRGTGYGSVYNKGPNANWIADHDSENVCGGTGKSLRLD